MAPATAGAPPADACMRLTLRHQLLIIALLVLALPLAAWQFARQAEQSLRQGHAQGLLDTARSIATTLAQGRTAEWPEADSDVLYVHRSSQPPLLDGYADDWARWDDERQTFASEDGLLQVGFSATGHGSGLYLLFHVQNPRQVFSDPNRGRGDHLRLYAEAQDRRGELTLAPLAPGWLETRGSQGGGWPRAQGVWQSRGNGWTLELQLPDSPRPQQLAFTIHDSDRIGHAQPARSAGTDGRPRTLVQRRTELDAELARLAPAGTQAWVSLNSGWVLGAADRRHEPGLSTGLEEMPPSWLDTLLFERLLSGRLAIGQWRHEGTARLAGPEVGASSVAAYWTTRADDPGILLTVSAPLIIDRQQIGSVVLSRDADALLLQSNRAVLRLLGSSLATLGLMALILFGFATILSERIRRLRNRAEQAVGPDGRVRDSFPAPRAPDELGDLGRSVSALLGRLREHQDYLRTLADKLAHELRTPLAMIRSSLDNLEHARDPEDIARYCRRANEGSARLNRIFQAMSQASRIEDSIRAEAARNFDLAELLAGYIQACRNTYPERRFELKMPAARSVMIQGSPDLFAQLLDKLIDNAVDFSPQRGRISLRLSRRRGRARLELENEGPALPEGTAESLFDSMVSRRKEKTEAVHLGLGLYIARLVAEYHGAEIRAFNTQAGVCVAVEMDEKS